MTTQTRTPGAQPENTNARKSGIHSQRRDPAFGLGLPYVPRSMKHWRPKIRQYLEGLQTAAEAKYGTPLPIHVASAVHAAAMSHAREVLIWGYWRRHADNMTPEATESYLARAAAFCEAREKAVGRLRLGGDGEDVMSRVMNEPEVSNEHDQEDDLARVNRIMQEEDA